MGHWVVEEGNWTNRFVKNMGHWVNVNVRPEEENS